MAPGARGSLDRGSAPAARSRRDSKELRADSIVRLGWGGFELADRFFTLTSLGELLRTDAPGSMRNVAVLYGEDWLWQAYANLSFSAQTGRPAFPEVHGLSFYDFLTRHPRAGAVFQAAMTGFSEQEATAILDAYDFVGVKTVLDVGAGHGALLAAILRRHPYVSGVAFDWPAAVASAERLFEDAGLGDRAAFIGGDFFNAVPSGADLLVLKSVLHNWDDASARRILRTCRRASSLETRLLVIERVIPAGPAPSEAKLFDINMLVTVGGRERTQDECEALMTDTGFVLTRVIPTASPLTLLEALPDGQSQ